MPENAQSETTRILAELAGGDRANASRLFSLVYDELRAVAAGLFRRQPTDHTLQPTALVHEAYLRLVNHTRAGWENRAHFLAVAAKAMRRILINYAHKRGALKRGGDRERLTLVEELTPARSHEIDLIALDEALTKLGALSERMVDVVEFRYFGGMTMQEIAHTLGVSKRTVETDWEMARAWLSRELSDGEPP